MPRFEYKVVPAPSKGIKGKGVRGADAKFAFAIQELMNAMAGYGWEYQRAEILPSVERAGLTGTTTEWRNVLVFRRPRRGDASEFQPELLPAPSDVPDQSREASEKKGDSEQMDGDFAPDDGGKSAHAIRTIGASLSRLARARNTTKPTTTGDSEKDAKPET